MGSSEPKTGSDTTSYHGGGDGLLGLDRAAIDRFCCQYLQLETPLDYPDGQILKRPDVQEEIFDRMFSGQSHSSKITRFQLRALKELVARIQTSISDDESNDYEVSDKLMDRLGELMFHPLMPEADEAQQRRLVTYHMSLLQPPAPIYILENRSLISAGGTTGLRTWEAGLYFGQYLCVNPHLVAGKRVLELGTGTGYLSILCAKFLDAVHVTASDGAEEVVDNLADNFILNDLEWDFGSSRKTRLSPKLLKWGHALVGTEEPEWIGGQKVDLIIGADITYDQKANPSLVSTLSELLELYPDAEVIVATIQRNTETLSIFQDACTRNRLRLEELEFTTREQEHVLELRGQPHGPLTPFYSTQAPMRIFQVSHSAKKVTDSLSP
ncbi:hypothetical protein VM1G_08631 [Cytospora mali]|uniref:Protein-lysine N-methyltransferase EFM3 n=1 Tax=Cytospora mali TaxID=578113 RepID=A0A194W915_CYTMA|nr:hypothetical protein VM1G_08631 [Valsa mali]